LPGSRSKKSTVFLKGIFPEISSTEIKKALFTDGVSKNIPPSVLAFIKRKKLYLTHIHRWLKLNLSVKRFKHCKETTNLSLELADKYGLDIEKTAMTALLHDAARDFKKTKLKLWARKNKERIPFFKATMANEPLIFHAYMSAYIAQNKFSIKDKNILDAIKTHTIGAAKMSILAKIIYISDLAGKDKNVDFALPIRKRAFLNLDKAFFSALKCKMEYVKRENKWVHPHSHFIYQSFNKKRSL